MPRIVGLEASDFDPNRYRTAFGDNHGDPITTDGLMASVSEIKKATTEDLRQALKASPLFVSTVDK